MQKRWPLGAGPSEDVAEVRRTQRSSGRSRAAILDQRDVLWSAAKKLGQPVPLSSFDVRRDELRIAGPQRYVPSAGRARERAVPASRVRIALRASSARQGRRFFERGRA